MSASSRLVIIFAAILTIASYTSALPQFLSLHKRRHSPKETVVQTADGAIHCFTSGSLVLPSAIDQAIRLVCGSGAPPPSGTVNQSAIVPHQYINVTTPGNPIYLKVDFDMHSDAHSDPTSCKTALGHVTECPKGGDQKDMLFGGWFRFNDDQSSYGVDPTFLENGKEGE